MRPLISLCMIVRDEAARIRETLESVRGVADLYVIHDTGSVDDTVAIFDAHLKEIEGRPGLFQVPMSPIEELLPARRVIHFAKTRNAVLDRHAELPSPAEFTLFLSGDEVLENGAALREYLETQRGANEGAYRVELVAPRPEAGGGGATHWLFPRVLRTDAGWRYQNPIHESPVSPSGLTGGPTIPHVSIRYAPSDQTRFFTRLREVDVPVLEWMTSTKPSTHEEFARYAHALSQLGQTHENLALEQEDAPGSPRTTHLMQAMSYYWRRFQLAGDPDGCNYAGFKFYEVAGRLGIYNYAELVERLKVLAEIDPRRPEVRYLIAANTASQDARRAMPLALEAVKVAREAKKDPSHLPTDDRCEWLSLQLAASCARTLGVAGRARELARQGIAAGGPEEAFREFLEAGA